MKPFSDFINESHISFQMYDKNTLSFISEAQRPSSSVEEDELTHLTHVKDLPHEDAKHGTYALELLKKFHQLRQGKKTDIEGSLKTDGGASVHIIHDDHGVGVTDKHRFKRGIIARTPQEIDQHFGHAPEYAHALKHLLSHGHEIVNKGHHVQGDLLFTPRDNKPETHNGKTERTPNRITYGIQSNAPLGIALHTELKGRVAGALSREAINKSDNVFVPEDRYKPDPKTYSDEDRKATEEHLRKAEQLLRNHSTDHLTPDHIKHFTIYLNRSTRTGTEATVEGYKKHLMEIAEKEAQKRKSAAGQEKIRGYYKELAKHVDKNKRHFQRSLDIRHHLGQATESLLRGITHPDMETTIDGKPSQGEGIVIQHKGRPVAKLVPQEVSRKILNNPRFGRGE